MLRVLILFFLLGVTPNVIKFICDFYMLISRYFSKKRTKISTLAALFSCVIVVQGCKQNIPSAEHLTLEHSLAQKIMLDLRYYCPEATLEESAQAGFQCKKPVTRLHKDLAQLITETSLGGVILFANNINTVEQTVTLTRDLQNAALKSDVAQPLFISTDQEGGRVVRIPREIGTSFTGNMSIGATYAKHGDKYARQVGQVLGSELNALGINVNHGPDVDVNVNPDNPVINVRSFSENPKVVADLGIGMLEGIESSGVMATLKHFPGHGDTSTDSHTGLPKVSHDLALAKRVDLYPFQQAIENSNVHMIMTAHIQYPALDSSEIVNKFGQSMIKPATLSKKILTNLLRDEMGYQGLIITDALDMAGISGFFTPMEAVLATFDAGADIAMMPIKIRTHADIKRFKTFLKYLTVRVQEEQNMLEGIDASVARILKAKQKISHDIMSDEALQQKITSAKKILGNEENKAIEASLAQHAIVEIDKINPLKNINILDKKIHVVFPQPDQSNAMATYLLNAGVSQKITQSSLRYLDDSNLLNQLDNSDVVIVACDSQKSVVELGGVEDILQGSNARLNYSAKALKILKYAKKQGKTTVFVTLKLPTKLAAFNQYSDWLLATFDGNTYVDAKTNKATSPALSALAVVITGQQQAQGVLPITL